MESSAFADAGHDPGGPRRGLDKLQGYFGERSARGRLSALRDETTMAINVFGGCSGCSGYELLMPNAWRHETAHSAVPFIRYLEKSHQTCRKHGRSCHEGGPGGHAVKCVIWHTRTWLRNKPVIAPREPMQRHWVVAARKSAWLFTATTGDKS